jgi:hypothetical protein
MTYLDITEDELQEIYEEVMTFLGGEDVDVDLTKKEVLITLRNALLKFEKETAIWQLHNQFINTYGLPAGLVLTNQIATINYALVRQITDWFSSMQRVGGKIPWHKDYITLEPGRQIYNMALESSKPYAPGTRRIHRVLWVARPEVFGSHFSGRTDQINGDDVLYNNAWNFTNSGLNFGNNRLGFLGYTFDTVMMLQAVETRNKILFSEFFHNISGDILEITPMPGHTLANIGAGTRVFYYYWDEAELLSGQPNIPDQSSITVTNIGQLDPGSDIPSIPASQYRLIANPLDMRIEAIPWSYLSPWARAFVKEISFALCKYIQASKWRKIKKTFATGEMEYEIEFDYSSLLDEARNEEERAITNLRTDFEKLNLATLLNTQKDMTEAARTINKNSGRTWFIGGMLGFLLSQYLML